MNPELPHHLEIIGSVHLSSNHTCAFSSDGRKLISTGAKSTIWDPRTRLALAENDYSGNSCALSPDGRHAAIGGEEEVALWDYVSGNTVRLSHLWLPWNPSMPQPDLFPVTGCAFSHDGRLLASAHYGGGLKLWNVGNQREQCLLNNGSGPSACAFSPDHRFIVSGSISGELTLWSVDDGHEYFTVKAHAERIRRCAFSPDGQRILSCSDDGTLRLTEVTQSRDAVVFNHGCIVSDCVFSPDGRRVVSVGEDGSLKLWDIAGQRLRHTWQLPEEPICLSCAQSSRNLWSEQYHATPSQPLAVTFYDSGTILIFDLATFEP